MSVPILLCRLTRLVAGSESMRVITSIYSRVRHRLGDDWAFSSEQPLPSRDSDHYEAYLARVCRWYHVLILGVRVASLDAAVEDSVRVEDTDLFSESDLRIVEQLSSGELCPFQSDELPYGLTLETLDAWATRRVEALLTSPPPPPPCV